MLIFEILAVICLAGFGFRRWRFGYELDTLTLTLSLSLALALTLTLTLTRYELGGRGKYTTGLVFGSLWVLFITLSSIYLMHDIAIF